MFNYSLPNLKIKLNTRLLSITATLTYILSVIPLLVVSMYNWPSADDMSLALLTYRSFKDTGNIVVTFFTAFKVGINEYLTWMGYYFSNVMFCYSPSIFGEKWYVLVGFEMLGILTFGVCYFFNALFVRALKCDRHMSNVLAMITLTVIVQSMPKGLVRVEAFYWYSGAINYMFMFSMALFWLGLMIRTVTEDDKKARFRKLLWACFWGFWLGGANYMTALQVAICSFLIIVVLFMNKAGKATVEVDSKEKEKSFKLIWIPACVNLLGFLASCLAPGNATREALVEGFGPVKSIFIALLYDYVMLINDFTRWEVLAAAALLIPVSWKLCEGVKHRFQHPFVFTIFALGMSASNMVPPLYALANLEAGRLQSIIYAEYIVMMMLTVFYVTAWARQTLEEKHGSLKALMESRGSLKNPDEKSALSYMLSSMLLACAAFIVFGSALCVYDDHHYYSATAAISDVFSGNAAMYLKENEERLEVLKDESVKDAVLKPHSGKPSMLVFDDITDDKEYWINRVMARYYEKESVALGGEN